MRKLRDPYERFMAKVDKRGDGCWVWNGSPNPQGYGSFSVGGKLYAAHRWSLEQKLGRKLQPGEVARHTCDNPPCVNPDHLIPGTQADNVRDRVERGPKRRGPHADCDHESTKQARAKCREKNGKRQRYYRGISPYERFMKYVDTETTPNGCHEWTGVQSKGYGRFDTQTATRWLLGYLRGKGLTPDEVVLHVVCDNPPCCNPAHLRIGTHTENMQDKVAKGRHHGKRKTHCVRGHAYTEENTYIQPSNGYRQCRACWAVRRKEKRAARPTPASA